jgi:hypothetical protein
MSDLALAITGAAGLLTTLGGALAWVAARITAQSARFDRMEERYNHLHREHTLVLVKMERFRLAFQIVAAAMAREKPGDSSLVHARAILADQWVFPSDEQIKTPADMADALKEMDEAGVQKR